MARKAAGRAAECGRRMEAKTAAKKRWEVGKFEAEEEEAYGGAMWPISNLMDESEDLEELAAGKCIAHMAGMQVVEDHWEEERDLTHTAPPPPLWQQQQGEQQQQLPGTPGAPQ